LAEFETDDFVRAMGDRQKMAARGERLDIVFKQIAMNYPGRLE
jgi:hypothetical protein